MTPTKRIKVAILTAYNPFPSHNGGWAYINNLARYLGRRDDAEVHIVTFGDEERQFKDGDLNIHMAKKIIKHPGPLTILQTLSLRRKIMEIEPHLVNLYGAGSSTAYILAATLIQNKFPVVHTMVGIWSKDLEYYNKKRVVAFIIFLGECLARKYLLPRIPNIIVETSSLKSLVSQTTNSRIYVISNGVEFEMIQSIPPANLNEAPDIFVLAALERIKGVDILLKSIPLVLKSFPNLKVYSGGSGSEERKLKNLVKELNLKDHVRFLGHVAEEKFQYYKACKMAVIPSRWDCQPTALLEAMACGTPVVASNVGGIPDTVVDGKTGLLFESENAQDFASKIITLLQDERLREEMGNAARERARERDWAKIAEKYVEVYKDIISNSDKQKALKSVSVALSQNHSEILKNQGAQPRRQPK